LSDVYNANYYNGNGIYFWVTTDQIYNDRPWFGLCKVEDGTGTGYSESERYGGAFGTWYHVILKRSGTNAYIEIWNSEKYTSPEPSVSYSKT